MERFKKEPISTTIGLILIGISIALLWVGTNYEVPLVALPFIFVAGLLLINAKDQLIDILTLGLSRFIQDRVKK